MLRLSSALVICCCAVALLTANPCSLFGQVKHTSQATASSDFAEAKQLLGSGALDAAMTAVNRGLAVAPRNIIGLNLLGLIYHQQKRDAEAIEAFEKALAIDPRSVDTLNNLANSYATQGKLDLAYRTLHQTLRIAPRNRAANYNLGLLLLAEHKPNDAIAALEQVKPADSSTRLNLVRAYLMGGMVSRALQAAEQFSGSFPKDVKVHYSLGVVLASAKQYGAAVREFAIADTLQPTTFEIVRDLGLAYLRNNEPAKAQREFERAIKLQPASAESLLLLAEAEANQQDDVDALDVLVRARKLAPQNTDILLLMARISMKQSFYEDAIEVLHEALTSEPRRPELHAALGESYFMVGKVDQALQEFKTLLQLRPSAQSYAYMGLAYRDLGKYDEAKQFLDQGLKLDANDPVILYNLGYIAKRQGNAVAAEQYLMRAVQLDPKYGQALFELGSLKVEERKYEEAVPLLRRCAETSNSPAQAYYKLAIAERNMHQIEASQRDMKVFETLSKNPQVGPYPLHHVFEYLDRREALSPEQRAAADLQSLEAKAAAHPDWPRNWHLLAEAYLKAGRLDDAQEAFARLDSLSGGDIRTLLGEGVLLARYGFYRQAIERLQKALASDPSSDEALYDLATVYVETRDYANASALLERLSPAARKGNDYLALLADVDAHQDRMPEAIEALQKVVINSPDDDRYYFLLGLTEMRDGRAEDAYATLQRGLARVPDSAVLYWGLGIVCVARNEAGRAESYLRKSLALMPSREGPYLTLGIYYFEAGRIGEARQVFEQYKSAFPHPSMDVTEIRNTLDSAKAQGPSPQGPLHLSAEARHQFCQLALSLAEFEHH